MITADLLLDAGTGLEAVSAIAPQASIPVVFITGSAAEIRDQVSLHPVLDKPFSEQTLTYAVAASLAPIGAAPSERSEPRRPDTTG